eukprot:g46988.t1
MSSKGLGGGFKMAGNRKVLLIIAYRAQILRESVTKSALGLTNVDKATSGAMDAVDQVGGRRGEPQSDMERLAWALDGGERRGVGAGRHLGCPEVERSILGADAVEAEELGLRDLILTGRWVRGFVVKIAMGVSGFEIDVGVEMVTRDGDGDVQEEEGGIGDGPGEFVVGVKGADELFKLLLGAQGSANTVINIAEEEMEVVMGLEGVLRIFVNLCILKIVHTAATKRQWWRQWILVNVPIKWAALSWMVSSFLSIVGAANIQA